MASIVPTITAENAHVYREQIERVESFANRIHIDLMDGVFTENTSISPNSLWWPEATEVDIHLMYKKPMEALPQIIQLNPGLVIVQAESDCEFTDLAHMLNSYGIRAGISVLPKTKVEDVSEYLIHFDHLLIFSGNLGHQGGSTAELTLLEKISLAKKINADLELGWDGGINQENVAQIANAGVTVLNSGGFIHHAPKPEVAYNNLCKLLP